MTFEPRHENKISSATRPEKKTIDFQATTCLVGDELALSCGKPDSRQPSDLLAEKFLQTTVGWLKPHATFQKSLRHALHMSDSEYWRV